MTQIFDSLTLPNGNILKNRIAKAAMEEDMAEVGQVPDKALFELYRRWSAGGAGLLISGNVMIDRRAVTGPAAVVLERDSPLEPFQKWAEAGKQNGTKFWLQISHPGRAVLANLGGHVIAPSAIPMNLGKHTKLFGQPRAMTEAEIGEVIQRFADAAKRAEQAGFDGIQLHAAHGYLFSQFLSPLSNQRNDAWGGSLENRARLLLEVVRAIRVAVKPNFAVALKLNSADFQRGGFEAADAQQVVRWLNELAVDLVEVSGGTYESPVMQGSKANDRTLAREAYFLEFARDMATVAKMPLMTTGGIRRPAIAETVLAEGVSVVGIATALALVPDLPMQWKRNQEPVIALPKPTWKDKGLFSLTSIAQVNSQLRRIGRGLTPTFNESPAKALIIHQIRRMWLTRRYRNWLATR